MKIKFERTRNIDLIEAVANDKSIQKGTCGGNYFEYNPKELYFASFVDEKFVGIVRATEAAERCYEVHAMLLADEAGGRKFSKKLGIEFWKFFFSRYDALSVLSMASDHFLNGKVYCAMVGLKRRGIIPAMFNGVDVTIYSATKEELLNGWKQEKVSK